MKLKELWNKFLELRKSPTFIAMSFFGFIAIAFYLIYLGFYILSLITTQADIGTKIVFPPSLFLSIFVRYEIFIIRYYFFVIPFVFLIEFILNIRLRSDFAENNKIYIAIWTIGIIVFFITTIINPVFFKPLEAVLENIP